MNLEMLQKQNDRMEGFREGYMACLNWIAAHIQQEEANKKAESNVVVSEA